MHHRHLVSLLALLSASLAGPAPAAPEAPRCQYAEVATLPLHYTGTGLGIATTGTINGKPADMLVDTGAYRTFMTRTGTERQGLPIWPTGELVGGVGGEAQVYKTRIDEFSIGPAGSPKGYLPVLSDFGFIPSFDALVGAPFLLRFDLELSLATKEMRLLSPRNCERAFMGYWDPAPHVIPFADGHVRFTNPRFAVTVNGVKLTATIDTGAGSSWITLDAAKRVGFKGDTDGLPGSPGVGVGNDRPRRWTTTFASFEIGDEVVNNAPFDVIVTPEEHEDVTLGADFLRSHRVLFAMSQKKLYFSYVGGDPFHERGTLPAWIVAEANAGNAHAQYALSQAYRDGENVARNPVQAERWREQAAAGGSPMANFRSARDMLGRGEVTGAIARYQAGLERLPTYRWASLWLYVARLRAGQAELGKRELERAFARVKDNEWPAALANFYLGKNSVEAVLKEAASGDSPHRTCDALELMGAWAEARGDRERSGALETQYRERCGGKAAKPD